eukprot:gene35084-42493_t
MKCASLVGFLGLISLVLVGSSWIDPDTPDEYKSTVTLDKKETFKLVFSDEFNIDGRQFHDGHDPKWTAINKNDYTNYALQYYNSSLVTTHDGYLDIATVNHDVSFDIPSTSKKGKGREKKTYQSGMLQGWNKFCFTGGVVEVRARLPGKYNIAGLWPAIWLLGNLARATYVGSSNNVWPWSYDRCSPELQQQQ